MTRIADWLIGFLRAAVCIGILLGLLYLGGCAAATPAGACISPEIQARCNREGGCTLFSRAGLEELVQEIAQAARQSCKGST